MRPADLSAIESIFAAGAVLGALLSFAACLLVPMAFPRVLCLFGGHAYGEPEEGESGFVCYECGHTLQ